MAFVYSNRVKQISRIQGTGDYTLGQVPDSYQSVLDGVGAGNSSFWCATDGDDFEVFFGTVSGNPTTVSRTTVIESSNSGSAVNWGSDEKEVFCVWPANGPLRATGLSDLVQLLLEANASQTANLLEVNSDGASGGDLFSITSGGLVNFSYETGITASTTQSQGERPLTKAFNQVSTGDEDDVVTLPSAAAGRMVWVFNNTGNTLQVFPASGDDLGAGTNNSGDIPVDDLGQFFGYSSTQWNFLTESIE